MSGLFIIIGVLALEAGLIIVAIAIRNRGDGENPKATAMLIGGMMLTTFGLLLTIFPIVYAAGDPPSLDAEPAR